MTFALVAAVDQNNGLGKDNKLVWRLPADMKHFTEITTKTSDASKFKRNAVIMGRKTWESIPEKHRPLKDRINIILSRNRNSDLPDTKENLNKNSRELVIETWENSLEDALELCKLLNTHDQIENIFVIGGAMLYAEAVNHPDCQTIYLTRIHQAFDCDAFFPHIDEKIFEITERSGIKRENDLDFEFLTYQKIQRH